MSMRALAPFGESDRLYDRQRGHKAEAQRAFAHDGAFRKRMESLLVLGRAAEMAELEQMRSAS